VDIDPQAVEVTKLSLLLKVLEGENEQTLSQQLTKPLPRARAARPGAATSNAATASSAPTSTTGAADGPSLDEEKSDTASTPSTGTPNSPKVMAAGGFDAVIGNPPYIRIQAMKEYAPQEVEFYKQAYVAAGKGNYDIYVVFVEKGLSLLRAGGRLGYILPHKFFNAQYGAPLRGLIGGASIWRTWSILAINRSSPTRPPTPAFCFSGKPRRIPAVS
jgi:hypothetical protein